MAENDKYNLLPSGTKAVFVQAAAPTGWTKDNANNDSVLRIVDNTGTGGATGGSDSISVPTHTYTLATAATDAITTGLGVYSDGANGLVASSGAGGSSLPRPKSTTGVASAAYKYQNVLVCSHT